MNLKDLHLSDTEVQTKMLFPTTEGKVISLQIAKGGQLKEHLSKVPALLVCVSGSAVYFDETNSRTALFSGDFVQIAPNIRHGVDGLEDSNFLLIK